MFVPHPGTIARPFADRPGHDAEHATTVDVRLCRTSCLGIRVSGPRFGKLPTGRLLGSGLLAALTAALVGAVCWFGLARVSGRWAWWPCWLVSWGGVAGSIRSGRRCGSRRPGWW
jgi:hypothetical protein